MTIQHFDTSKNFAYFVDMEENESKCREKKECVTRTPVRHYRACAIVGNGGILLNSSCGNEIDCHHYVIRINMAPVRNYVKVNIISLYVLHSRDHDVSVVHHARRLKLGFLGKLELFVLTISDVILVFWRKDGCELLDHADGYIRNMGSKDVGTKTNMTIVNWTLTRILLEKLSDKNKRNEVLKSLSSVNHGVISYIKIMTGREDCDISIDITIDIYIDRQLNRYNVMCVYSFSSLSSMLRTTLVPKLRVPTSGLIAYILGTTFCDVITLYGFYPFTTDMRNRTLFYHYYDHIPVNHKTKHNFNIEYDFLTSLHKNGAIRLVSDICK
ncbi:alpha-2,8-sialyltransferase 8B-like [Branchiostoma lanceolatum]|uniref:alpha-2,8-sialyltransferase 8B-like n=1 Tax=Branchiostoma lanceolatum TaxID=7740 RepID=UPI0034525716